MPPRPAAPARLRHAEQLHLQSHAAKGSTHEHKDTVSAMRRPPLVLTLPSAPAPWPHLQLKLLAVGRDLLLSLAAVAQLSGHQHAALAARPHADHRLAQRRRRLGAAAARVQPARRLNHPRRGARHRLPRCELKRLRAGWRAGAPDM